MMQKLFEEASDRLHVEKIALDVSADNLDAIRFYQKFGFVQEGRLKNEIKINGKYEDLVVMGVMMDKIVGKNEGKQ